MPEASEKVLTILQGSEHPFDILLFDENDNPDDLTLVTEATFVVVRDVADSSTPVIDIDTSGNLSIDKPNSRLTGFLSLAEAQALPTGTFVGQTGVLSDGAWYYTDYFNVVIRRSFAGTT